MAGAISVMSPNDSTYLPSLFISLTNHFNRRDWIRMITVIIYFGDIYQSYFTLTQWENGGKMIRNKKVTFLHLFPFTTHTHLKHPFGSLCLPHKFKNISSKIEYDEYNWSVYRAPVCSAYVHSLVSFWCQQYIIIVSGWCTNKWLHEWIYVGFIELFISTLSITVVYLPLSLLKPVIVIHWQLSDECDHHKCETLFICFSGGGVINTPVKKADRD